MNIRDLEYLVAVDEERHFHKAARRCFASQPTLSGQLKKLEEDLGVVLIERSRRQVRMTDVGRAVAQQARVVLREVRALREITQHFHDPMGGELQVGLIPTLAPYLLPLLLPALTRRFPALKLWLHEHQTGTLLDRLRNGDLDLLLLALPVSSDEFEEIALCNEPFWLAVARDDPLADHAEVRLPDLKGRQVLLLEEGHCLRGQALDVCFTAEAIEDTRLRATSIETLRHMVGEGLGITLMPEFAVPRRRTRRDPVCYIPFADPAPVRRVGMLYRKGAYRGTTYEQLAGFVRTLLPENK